MKATDNTIKTLTANIAKAKSKYEGNRNTQRKLITGKSLEFFENPSEEYDKLARENMKLLTYISTAENAIAALKTLAATEFNF